MTERYSRKTGACYEEMACQYLRNLGYVIMDRNFRNRIGEIDIIAFDPAVQTVCFVEVKYRKDLSKGRPAAAVTWKKQQVIIRVSSYYMYIRRLTHLYRRYDIIEILGGEINHIRNAFTG